MKTQFSCRFNSALSVLCLVALAVSLFACDYNLAPSELNTPRAPANATEISTATNTPVAPSTTSPVLPQSLTVEPTARPTPCTQPAIVGTLNLLPLPAVVREPLAMTRFKGKIYVAGHHSNNLGVIENDQLSRVIRTGDGPISLTADEALGRLFVLNHRALSVSMLDGQQVLATLPISDTAGEGYQYADTMIGDAQGHRLFVALQGRREQVVVIDAQTFSVTARLQLDGPRSVGSLAFDSATNRLMVNQADSVMVFDLQNQKLVDTFELPGFPYRVMVYDGKRRRLYANYYKPYEGNYLAVLEDGKLIASLPLGADPYGALMLNDRLYVTNSFSNTVSVLDLQNLKALPRVDVGLTPRALAADEAVERLYVAVAGDFGHEFNRVEVVDLARNEVVKVIPLAAQAHQLIADSTRNRLYALMPASNAIFVSDGQRVLQQIKLERAPFQMALDEASGKLYVTDFLSGNLSVIEATSGTIGERKQLNLSTRLNAVAVDKTHHQLLVNNRRFSLDQLAPTGHYSITGFTLPYGDGIQPDALLVNNSVPRFFAIAHNGVPGSNSGTILYLFDSEALKQIKVNSDRNVTAVVFDDNAQRLYESVTHPLALSTKLNVFDGLNLNLISSLDLPTRVTALALNPQTHHLFVTYSEYGYRASAADNMLEILDTRSLGRVGRLAVPAEPSALAHLGERIYLASKTNADLTIVHDCAGEVPPAPTATFTPTPYPTFPPAPTPTATRTPTRVPSPAAQRATATPPPCAQAIANWLQAQFAQDNTLRTILGCPVDAPRALTMAEQTFQNGWMIWREDIRKIYVLLSDNSWAVYDDTWASTQPEGGTETPPSPGLLAPKRGFGKVWREKLGGPSAALGWATADERAFSGQAQNFERGFALDNDRAEMRILLANGSWR